MPYGLTDDTVKKIQLIFSQFREIEKAILYGSRAKGNHKNGSDIDLTLHGAEINLKLLNRLNLALDDLLLPYTFDLSIYHQITNQHLIDHIQRVGKVFYEKNNLVASHD